MSGTHAESGEETQPSEASPLLSSPHSPRWLTKGVWGIGLASFLADVGHEVPTALFASFVTVTLGAPAALLGLIEGLADGLAGLARFAGGALADDASRRRSVALGGYSLTAILLSFIGVAGAVWQVALLRMAAWTSRGFRVPARNALLADMVHSEVYGRAYGFERMMDNLGAIGGPLLALGLVTVVGVRTAIELSVIPGLLAALAILYAIRHIPHARNTEHVPLRITVRPLLKGRLSLSGGMGFDFLYGFSETRGRSSCYSLEQQQEGERPFLLSALHRQLTSATTASTGTSTSTGTRFI